MPVRRGHVAPKTTLIETIIRKFDTHSIAADIAETTSIDWIPTLNIAPANTEELMPFNDVSTNLHTVQKVQSDSSCSSLKRSGLIVDNDSFEKFVEGIRNRSGNLQQHSSPIQKAKSAIVDQENIGGLSAHNHYKIENKIINHNKKKFGAAHNSNSNASLCGAKHAQNNEVGSTSCHVMQEGNEVQLKPCPSFEDMFDSNNISTRSFEKNRSFLVANAQPESCHIIFCSDGFCKMTGFTRAEVMQRSACTEFLQGQMTSHAVVQSIKQALRKGEEQHFEILYYRKNAVRSSCSSEVNEDLEMSNYSASSSQSTSEQIKQQQNQPGEVKNASNPDIGTTPKNNEKKLVAKQKINSIISGSSSTEPKQHSIGATRQQETALGDSVGSGVGGDEGCVENEETYNMNINALDEGVVESPVMGGTQATLSEERLRRKLQFFFMNPIEKWQAKRRFPYKFVVQVIKIVLVTLQLCLFAHSRYMHVNYTWDNSITFSHLFLRGWDITMEVSTYPPETGPLSVYVIEDFFKTIDYAIDGYANLSEAIGPYSYPNEDNTMAPMQFCLYRYKDGTIFGFNESYVFNPEIDTLCLDLDGNVTTIGSRKYLHQKDIHINFSALVKAELKFAIKTVNFKAAGPIAAPDCYQFDIQILFNNQDHDGQMTLRLEAEPTRLVCHGDVEFIKNSQIDNALRSVLNILVMLICVVSFALCARAVFRAQLLRIITCDYFKQAYGKDLTVQGKWEFVNMWYIMIVLNDVLLVVGSALKEQIEQKHFIADDWNLCSLLLGIGNLLVWFGVLRYLGFFKTYNVVILTLKSAAPKILRFLLCALLIYAGFTFCGWLVLGPYHIKFRSLSTTSECLFSLINGDDMFATFTIMSDKSLMLWWFCRIYLYSFTSLYIYVVLSLFISVIMDAYDTIKKYYKEGFPQNDLRIFVGPYHPNDFSAGVFRDDDYEGERMTFLQSLRRLFCFWKADRERGPTGYTSLMPKASSSAGGYVS